MSLTPIVWRSSWAPRQCLRLLWWTSTCESHSSRRRCDNAGLMESPADMIAGGTTRRGAAITLSERKASPAPLATSMATDILAHPSGGCHPRFTKVPLTNVRGKHHKKVCVTWFKWVSDSSSKGERWRKICSELIAYMKLLTVLTKKSGTLQQWRQQASSSHPENLLNFIKEFAPSRIENFVYTWLRVCVNVYVYAPMKWLIPLPRPVPSGDYLLHERYSHPVLETSQERTYSSSVPKRRKEPSKTQQCFTFQFYLNRNCGRICKVEVFFLLFKKLTELVHFQEHKHIMGDGCWHVVLCEWYQITSLHY